MILMPLETLLIGTSLLLFTASLSAAPQISVDSANFDCGIIREGAQKSIKHEFKITNTGDEKLLISRVRPGCGCTAVSHDSVILPGKVGLVTAEVNLANFKPGTLRKYVTVYSNAKKTPEMSLSLGCIIRSDLSIEPSYIRITADKNGMVSQTLTVTSNKKDLQILDVNFLEDEKAGSSNLTWQNNLPIVFVHKVVKTDKVLPDGFTEYTLDISSTIKDTYSVYGKFNFKTNYPGKDLVTLTGVIEPASN
jgi:hypothetical protein